MDLVLSAPNASGTDGSGFGLGSHGIHAKDSNLALERVKINQGNGSGGGSGAPGTNASQPAPLLA